MKRVYLVILMAGLILVCNCPIQANIVALWTFNDQSNPAHDDSGNGQNGTVYGATWVPNGSSGGALWFDGQGDYVAIPDHPTQSGMSQLRLDAWIHPSDIGAPPAGQAYAMEVVNKWGLGGIEDDSYGMYITRTENSDFLLMPAFWISGGSDEEVIGLISDTPIPFNQWTHLTAVYDGLSSHIYIDEYEVAVSNVSIPGIVVQDTYEPILIGKGFFNPYIGMIDEVRIAIPEPTSVLLLGLGGLVLRRRRR